MSIHLGAALCADLLLTGSTVFCLLVQFNLRSVQFPDARSQRHSKTILRWGPTAPILNSLLRGTIHSAAPAAVCALINFVAIVLVHKQPGIPVSSMVGSGSNTVLPQLYAWPAMWTLNSREGISLAANNGDYTLHPGLSSTSDSETAGNPHAGANKMIGLQGGQDKLVSFSATEMLQQNGRMVCVV
ncbi:hypothetical protein B0H19DRAFT_316561 [Mycena capillaripes]|nr:hypothetical protein B0H19DRAFT_316561 [Mycena capillaripes]